MREYSLNHGGSGDKNYKSLFWYNQYDYLRTRKQERITVALMARGMLSPDDPDHCFRGLEQRIKPGRRERNKNRFLAALTVILEQDRQYFESVHDEQILAKLYSNVTGQCAYEAYERGLADRLEANRAYCDNVPSDSAISCSASLQNAFQTIVTNCDDRFLNGDRPETEQGIEATVGPTCTPAAA